MMYENNAVNEMIANLLQVSVEDLAMLGYDLQSLAITNPEHIAQIARKIHSATQRKNDFAKKNRQKKMSAYAYRSGKSIKDNGAIHSRACRTTYGKRPKPKRWTNANALAVMDEYEKNVRQDTLEYYEAMEAEEQAYYEQMVQRLCEDDSDYAYVNGAFVEIINVPEAQVVNHVMVADYSKPFSATITMTIHDKVNYGIHQHTYMMASLYNPSVEELDKAIEMAKAKVLDLVREQVSAVVIDVTMIPVGNVQDYPMCIGSAMYIE